MTTIASYGSASIESLCRVDPHVEEYRGDTYRLERREIATMTNRRGYRVVWCWEVLSGAAQGIYGGKCSDKREARKWARDAIREWTKIRAEQQG